MKKTLKKFNELIEQTNNLCITNINDRTEWVIKPKPTVDEFIQSIERAIYDCLDHPYKITNAEPFDYGYSVEVTATYKDDDSAKNISIYLYSARVL